MSILNSCTHSWRYQGTNSPLIIQRVCGKCDISEVISYAIPRGKIVCPSCKGAGTKLKMGKSVPRGLFPIQVTCDQCAGSKFLEDSWQKVVDEGRRCEEARVNSRLSLGEVALQLDVSPLLLGRYERGEIERPW